MVLVPHVGPLVAAVERVGTFSYTIMQQREILGTPGLQHDTTGILRVSCHGKGGWHDLHAPHYTQHSRAA